MPLIHESRKGRLKHFVRDGVWASICEGFAENNFNTFATTLSASASDFALLTSSQSLTGCGLQLWSDQLTFLLKSRKRAVILCVSSQIVILFLMVIIALLIHTPFTFMSLSLIFNIIGSFSGSIWMSWISDLLPPSKRGFCFGVRNKFIYPIQFLALLSGGYLLQALQNKLNSDQGLPLAFCAIFSIGLIAKLFSLKHLFAQPEVRYCHPITSVRPLSLIGKSLKDPFLKKIILFFAIFGFAVNMSGPLQTPYLLQTLKYSYSSFSILNAAPLLARFFSSTWIGRIIDQTGYQKPFLASILMMPCLTLGWSISTKFFVILLAQLLSGLVWTTFELALFCFLTENSTSENRQQIYSLRSLSWNLFSSLGAIFGGFLIHKYHHITLVFWSSTITRLIASIVAILLFHSILQPSEVAEPSSP